MKTDRVLLEYPGILGRALGAPVAVLIALVLTQGAQGGTPDPLDGSQAQQNAVVTWADVGAPLHKFLLIRRENVHCAVVFTSFRRERNPESKSASNSGEDNFFAEYDWYYDFERLGEVTSAQDRGHREVSRLTAVGVGRLAFQGGDGVVRCGPFRLQWYYPIRVSFFAPDATKDTGIQLAPTAWDDLRNVNFEDPRLVWYGADEHRPSANVPANRLPGTAVGK